MLAAMNKIDWNVSPHIIISGIDPATRDQVVSEVLNQLVQAVGQGALYSVTADNAATSLPVLVKVMEERQQLLTIARAKNIETYNRMVAGGEGELDHIACVVTEMADFQGDVWLQNYIMQLTAMGRAVGIHMILLTTESEPATRIIPARIKTNVMMHIHADNQG